MLERKGSWESGAIVVIVDIGGRDWGDGGFYKKGQRKIGAIRETLNVEGAMNRKGLWEKRRDSWS